MSVETLEKQLGILAWAINDNMTGAAIVAMPMHTYTKGRLHLEQAKLLEKLLQGNHNVDTTFSMLFGESDIRDHRPLTFYGRLVFASPIGDIKNSAFGACALVRRGRTTEIPQLQSKDMREPEDLHPDALPPSTDSRDGVKGAKKYCQIGVRGCEALLNGMMDGISDEAVGILVIDTYPRFAEMTEAFMSIRLSAKNQLFYLGFCQDQIEQTWILNTITDKLANQYETDLRLPGGSEVQKELNEDTLEPIPALPKMNILTCHGEDGDASKVLGIDSKLVQEWCLKDAFTKEFTKWLDDFTMADNIVHEEAKGNELGKRRSDNEVTPQGKKRKVEKDCDVETTDLQSIKETLICEAKLPSAPKDAGFVQVRTSHTLYIINKSDCEYKFPAGTFVGGFGKGQFKVVKDDQPTSSILFQLSSSDDLVMFESKLLSLEEVIAEQRKTKPECKICYYKIVASEEYLVMGLNVLRGSGENHSGWGCPDTPPPHTHFGPGGLNFDSKFPATHT